MQVVTTAAELRRVRHALAVKQHLERFRRPVIGCVPTLGALHAGHQALIARMVRECEVSVVTIFLNPTQFSPSEDFTRYPANLEADLELCRAAGVSLVFAPSPDEMYPEGYQTKVEVTGLSQHWCGAARPGHFTGVSTVVVKLFNLVQPDRAYFGEKDFQQLRLIQRLVQDLDLPVTVVPCPTVRDADGLALSSRNKYLTAEERAAAPRLYQALTAVRQAFDLGECSADKLVQAGLSVLAEGGMPAFEPEYLAVVDRMTLEAREAARPADRVLAAARLGTTRLIDNLELAPL